MSEASENASGLSDALWVLYYNAVAAMRGEGAEKKKASPENSDSKAGGAPSNNKTTVSAPDSDLSVTDAPFTIIDGVRYPINEPEKKKKRVEQPDLCEELAKLPAVRWVKSRVERDGPKIVLFYAALVIVIVLGSALSVGIKTASGCDTKDPNSCNAADSAVQHVVVGTPSFIIYASYRVPVYLSQKAVSVFRRIVELAEDVRRIALRVFVAVQPVVESFAILVYDVLKLILWKPIQWVCRAVWSAFGFAYDVIAVPAFTLAQNAWAAAANMWEAVTSWTAIDGKL